MRGPAVFAGYWRQPEATAAAFADGWFRTGDLGERAADGYVTLRGRASELIISGGFNVYPREIEDVLLEQPGVREAAVVGAARRAPRRGAGGLLRGRRRAGRARGRLPPAARLVQGAAAFVRVDALPRNALGKVEKHRLSEPRARALGGAVRTRSGTS